MGSWLREAEKAACGAGLILLVLLVFSSAVLRFFRQSVSWNIDLAILLLAWTSFMGADVAWRSGQIIGVDLVTRALPQSLQRILSLVVHVIILTALVLMAVYGAKLAWSERLETFQSIPWIPYSLVTLSLVVAAVSMVCTTVQKIYFLVLTIMGKELPGSGTSGQSGPHNIKEEGEV
ncbi:MAG: TRAP transporter small permease [Spirochaetales bacterium]|nr:TRAP transporter small permease [Spirochaetales bacterium]